MVPGGLILGMARTWPAMREPRKYLGTSCCNVITQFTNAKASTKKANSSSRSMCTEAPHTCRVIETPIRSADIVN